MPVPSRSPCLTLGGGESHNPPDRYRALAVPRIHRRASPSETEPKPASECSEGAFLSNERSPRLLSVCACSSKVGVRRNRSVPAAPIEALSFDSIRPSLPPDSARHARSRGSRPLGGIHLAPSHAQARRPHSNE